MFKPWPTAVCTGTISTPGVNHGQPIPIYECSERADELLQKLGEPAPGWYWDGHHWRKDGVTDFED